MTEGNMTKKKHCSTQPLIKKLKNNKQKQFSEPLNNLLDPA